MLFMLYFNYIYSIIIENHNEINVTRIKEKSRKNRGN